jgi:hypothetical protein
MISTSSVMYSCFILMTLLPPTCLLVLAKIISLTVKMEGISSSETSVTSQQTTRRHIPEEPTLHNHCCENLKSYIVHTKFWLESLKKTTRKTLT